MVAVGGCVGGMCVDIVEMSNLINFMQESEAGEGSAQD